jgi:3-hydroxy-9,10-secoandrosta-1,3,5(10)-triene-9,17-dione monooxygenase
MDADWVMVGALCGPDDAVCPSLALLPAGEVEVDDVWQTAGMCATGSNDVIATGVFVPGHRLAKVADIYGGTAPGATLHDAPLYRWPLVPALSLVAAMPALGAAEQAADLFAARLATRILAYSGVAQKSQPAAQIRLGGARVRLAALHGLVDATTAGIESRVCAGERITRRHRAAARAAAAHIVHESRSVIADLLESAGAGVHFRSNPMQRAKRDVDMICGHVVFDYDTSRELAGACEIGAPVSPTAMI